MSVDVYLVSSVGFAHFVVVYVIFFVVKQKTAYEVRISDWSSDVCSSDLGAAFENLFACENGKEVVHVDKIRLIFQRIGHIIRIGHEIGRAPCRESVCPYVYISVVAGSLKKTRHHSKHQIKEHQMATT